MRVEMESRNDEKERVRKLQEVWLNITYNNRTHTIKALKKQTMNKKTRIFIYGFILLYFGSKSMSQIMSKQDCNSSDAITFLIAFSIAALRGFFI